LRRALFVLCTVLSLATAPLLELRYFILPFLLYRLHVRDACHKWHLLVEMSLYVIINVVVFYLFLRRPFQWPSEPGVLQRFMW
jgi:alpha-1,2-glucosyltransferase